MMRLAGVCVLFAALTGCIIGGDEMPGDNNTLGRICTAQVTTAGTFAVSSPAPTGYTGCWPIGMWTFTATVTTNDCTTKPTPLPQYQFKGELQIDSMGDEQQVFTYVTDSSVRSRIKVSQGGDGLCEGELNLFSADGKQVWLLKPELYADNHLGGSGEFGMFKEDQWLE